MKKVYYKVVQSRNRQLQSWIECREKCKSQQDYSIMCGIRGIRYQIGKWAKPKEGYGPLFVFSSKKAIRALIPHLLEDERVYECKIVKSKKKFMNLWLFPCGTVFADQVKLTRRVKLGE